VQVEYLKKISNVIKSSHVNQWLRNYIVELTVLDYRLSQEFLHIIANI
jgi:hypothetical protein